MKGDDQQKIRRQLRAAIKAQQALPVVKLSETEPFHWKLLSGFAEELRVKWSSLQGEGSFTVSVTDQNVMELLVGAQTIGSATIKDGHLVYKGVRLELANPRCFDDLFREVRQDLLPHFDEEDVDGEAWLGNFVGGRDIEEDMTGEEWLRIFNDRRSARGGR